MSSENVILLAENLPDDEFIFHYTLRRAGLDNPIFVVHDGVETLAYLNGESRFADRIAFPRPKVLVLDLAMPRMNGWEVLQWVRARPDFDDVFIVVLTMS